LRHGSRCKSLGAMAREVRLRRIRRSTDDDQKPVTGRHRESVPSVHRLNQLDVILFLGSPSGGLFLSSVVALCVNEDGELLRASLICLGGFPRVICFLVMLVPPLHWGLPPKWYPCKNNQPYRLLIEILRHFRSLKVEQKAKSGLSSTQCEERYRTCVTPFTVQTCLCKWSARKN